MTTGLQLVAVMGLSLAGAGGTYLLRGAPTRVTECDPATLKAGEICLQQVTEPVVWIDARPRKEWEANGLAGSILWNLDPAEDENAFEAEAMMQILENPRVVVYCSNEDCGVSKQVAEKVQALDASFEVKALRGGWEALRAAGRVKGSSGSP